MTAVDKECHQPVAWFSLLVFSAVHREPSPGPVDRFGHAADAGEHLDDLLVVVGRAEALGAGGDELVSVDDAEEVDRLAAAG